MRRQQPTLRITNFNEFSYGSKYDVSSRVIKEELPVKGWERMFIIRMIHLSYLWIMFNIVMLIKNGVSRNDAFGWVSESGKLTTSYATQKAANNYYAASNNKYWEESTVGSTSAGYTKYTNVSLTMWGKPQPFKSFHCDRYILTLKLNKAKWLWCPINLAFYLDLHSDCMQLYIFSWYFFKFVTK